MAWCRLAVAGVLAAGSIALALQHPVAPWAALGLVLALMAAVACRPNRWLWWLPALLPVISWAPWTGWWLIDESDLLVLALAAGAYANWGWQGHARASSPAVPRWLWWLLLASLGLGVWRGLWDAGGLQPAGWTAGLYASYDSAWNTLRVGKSLAWALLLAPLLSAPDMREGGLETLARGMVVGLALVCGAVLWERLAYAGLFEFDLPYRTSAAFWEMHVGGGAIDAYLAMSMPFAVWALWSARTPWRWAAANALVWAAIYAVLTTFSRGIYLALALTLMFMGVAAWRFRIRPVAGLARGNRGTTAVLVAVGLQCALVLGGGSFMAERLTRSNDDLIGRVAHWRAGASLLKTPQDALLGLGIGRLPAHYSRDTPYGEWPGSARWVSPGEVALAGPATRDELVGLFALAQRVELEPLGTYHARLRVTAHVPGNVVLTLCQRHLLYNYRCQWQHVKVDPLPDGGTAGWLDVLLEGDDFGEDGWRERLRGGVLAVVPEQVGGDVRLQAVELLDPQGRQVLANTDFSEGLAHWFPMASGHFLPWHMDNLYLELLIERGALGLLVMAIWWVCAAVWLWPGLRHGDPLAWVLAGSLFGVSALGAVISVTELPRLALTLCLLLFATSLIRARIRSTDPL